MTDAPRSPFAGFHAESERLLQRNNELQNRVAELEQERNALRQQIFKMHEVTFTYYGGCRCKVCDAHRESTKDD